MYALGGWLILFWAVLAAFRWADFVALRLYAYYRETLTVCTCTLLEIEVRDETRRNKNVLVIETERLRGSFRGGETREAIWGVTW
jgi:hypothetical protein